MIWHETIVWKTLAPWYIQINVNPLRRLYTWPMLSLIAAITMLCATTHADPAGSGPAATINSVTMQTGTLISGGPAELGASDDSHVHVRSGFGPSLNDLHKTEIIVGATTSVQSPTLFHVTIESRIDEPAGRATIRFRHWVGNVFETWFQYAIGINEEIVSFDVPNVGGYVDESGRIDMMIRHDVFVPFLAFTFDSYVDWVEIQVQ